MRINAHSISLKCFNFLKMPQSTCYFRFLVFMAIMEISKREAKKLPLNINYSIHLSKQENVHS